MITTSLHAKSMTNMQKKKKDHPKHTIIFSANPYQNTIEKIYSFICRIKNILRFNN